MIPKTRFCGKTRVQAAVRKTVIHFNSGSTSKAEIYDLLGVNPGENFFTIAHSFDQERAKNSERKVSDKERLRRKQRRAVRKKFITEDSIVNYMPGGFGLGKEPESLDGDLIKTAVVETKKTKKKLKKIEKVKPPLTETDTNIGSYCRRVSLIAVC